MANERAVLGRSTDHNDATDLQSQLADYYQWIGPNRGSQVYINFETAERLQIQVLRGLDFKGGVEVGGFLLGRSEFEEGQITAVIEDFEQVHSVYSNGPFYGATGTNAARFVDALEQYKSKNPSGLSIIGYYRSHKRDDLYLSADDLSLIRRAFPEPDNVFLLIKPLSIRACTGGFFCWDNDNIQSEFTLEVPFAPIRPPSPGPSAAEAIDDLLCPNRLGVSEELITQTPTTSVPRDVWPGRKRNLMALALTIILSLGVFGYWRVIRSVVKDPIQVAQPVSGSVQPGPISIEPAPEVPKPERQTRSVAQPSGPPQQTPPPKVFQPAVANPAPVAAAPADLKLEESPSLPSLSLPSEARITEVPLAPTAIVPPPALPPRSEPVIPPAAPSPVAPSVTNFAGPQITYRVNPSVPLDVRALMTGETQIDVTVKLDAAGKVTDAQVTSAQGAAARLVTAEAIKAARLCRFQPARENGRPVSSRMVLTFRFRK